MSFICQLRTSQQALLTCRNEYLSTGWAAVPAQYLGLGEPELATLDRVIRETSLKKTDSRTHLALHLCKGLGERTTVEEILSSRHTLHMVQYVTGCSGLRFSDPVVNELGPSHQIREHVDVKQEGLTLVVGAVLHLPRWQYRGGDFFIAASPSGEADIRVKVMPPAVVLFDERLPHRVSRVDEGTRRTLAFSYSVSQPTNADLSRARFRTSLSDI